MEVDVYQILKPVQRFLTKEKYAKLINNILKMKEMR